MDALRKLHILPLAIQTTYINLSISSSIYPSFSKSSLVATKYATYNNKMPMNLMNINDNTNPNVPSLSSRSPSNAVNPIPTNKITDIIRIVFIVLNR